MKFRCDSSNFRLTNSRKKKHCTTNTLKNNHQKNIKKVIKTYRDDPKNICYLLVTTYKHFSTFQVGKYLDKA